MSSLKERIFSLWEDRTRQHDMLRTLLDEGFEVTEREMMRLRAREGWLLQEGTDIKSIKLAGPKRPLRILRDSTKRKREEAREASDEEDDEPSRQLRQALGRELNGNHSDDENDEPTQASERDEKRRDAHQKKPKAQRPVFPIVHYPSISQEEELELAALRQQRFAELQAQSDELQKTGKRRRRTKPFHGLPSDPVGPPRFPSETTLEESKVALQLLGRDLYRETRDRFQAICEELNIIKKTDVGPERWQAAKDRLISQSPHLQQVFYPAPEDAAANMHTFEHKILCLDVICIDVTKRMRRSGGRLTILESRHALKINPQETKQARGIFYMLLKAEKFESQTLTGAARMAELKREWVAQCEPLRRAMDDGDLDGKKKKGLDSIAKDVIKRLKDDMMRLGAKQQPCSGTDGKLPLLTAQSLQGNSAQLTARQAAPVPTLLSPSSDVAVSAEHTAAIALAASAVSERLATGTTTGGDVQLDPTLLLAANRVDNSSNLQTAPASSTYSYPILDATSSSRRGGSCIHTAPDAAPILPPLPPTPVFFNLIRSHLSQNLPKPDWWMDMLMSFTLTELQQKVRAKHAGLEIRSIRGELDEGRVVISDDTGLRRYIGGVEMGRARIGIVVVG